MENLLQIIMKVIRWVVQNAAMKTYTGMGYVRNDTIRNTINHIEIK